VARQPRIVIIGAGVAGIATAVTLQHEGFHDFTILEKGTDVGGVWHWNRYPGLTCDVPSQLYQFSFAPKPDWTSLSRRATRSSAICATSSTSSVSMIAFG